MPQASIFSARILYLCDHYKFQLLNQPTSFILRYNKQIMEQEKSITSTRRLQHLNSLRSSIKQISIISQTDKMNDKYRRASHENGESNNPLFGLSFNEEVKIASTVNINSFLEKYKLKCKIGEGANACVYKCQNKSNNKIYAAKKFKVNQQEIFQLKKHFVYYRQLSCEYLIQYKALYFDQGQRTAYLVMEYYNHPSLTKINIKNEEELKNIVKKMIEAFTFLHDKNICHRDIKPDNILYDEKKKTIKLIDFGISKQIFLKGVRRQMLTVVGSPLYMAPQIYLGGGYDQRVDNWSLGVTIYKIVTGQTPFQSEYILQTIQKIKSITVGFEHRQWDLFDPLLKDFVCHLLKNRKKRMTLEEASRHLWLSSPKKIKLKKSSSQLQIGSKLLKNVQTKEEGMENCQQEQNWDFDTKDLDLSKNHFDTPKDDFDYYNPQEQKEFDPYRIFTPNVRSQSNQVSWSGYSFDNLFLQ